MATSNSTNLIKNGKSCKTKIYLKASQKPKNEEKYQARVHTGTQGTIPGKKINKVRARKKPRVQMSGTIFYLSRL